LLEHGAFNTEHSATQSNYLYIKQYVISKGSIIPLRLPLQNKNKLNFSTPHARPRMRPSCE